MKNKKSQIQMGETIAIIFIFTVLIIFGSVFYLRIFNANISDKLEGNLQSKTVEVAQKAAFFPEIQCSEEGIMIEDCIDLLKLQAASGPNGIISNNRLLYYDTFGFSRIYVNVVYPSSGSEIVLYDHNEAGDLTFTNRKTIFIPISVLDPRNNKFSFGYMGVEVFK